jgi:hypothetical protein
MSRHSQIPAQHAHRYAFEGAVLERVLLTIIKAHPARSVDGQDYVRLRVAMAALTGQDAEMDRDAGMSAAIDWMARERQRDLCDHDMKVLSAFEHRHARSVRELAMLAAYEFLEPVNAVDVHELAERLCAMFNERRRSMHLKGYDAEREVLETEAVERICAELAEWNFRL